MSGKLRDLLSLPEAKRAQTPTQAEEFYQAFCEGMSKVNGDFQTLTTWAYQQQLSPIADQRARIYEAFQKAWKLIDPADPTKAESAIQRVLAAVAGLEKKTSDLAAEVAGRHDQWLNRADEFDDTLLQINELAENQHPKAAALRKLGDAIRSRANDRKYDESVSALDQLRPKLEQIYADYFQQGGGDGHDTGDTDREPSATEAVVSQLHDQVAAEHAVFQAKANAVIESYPVKEVAQSAAGLIDGKWSAVDGLSALAEGFKGAQQLDAELKRMAKDVGVDLLMLGSKEVIKRREEIQTAMRAAEGVMDSDVMKLLGITNPLLEPAREIGLRLARGGAAAPDVAEKLIKQEEDIRTLLQMNSIEATEHGLEQLKKDETFETELHGGVEVHAELGVNAGAQVSTKAKKVSDNEFEVELQVGGKLMVGVGAGAQGEGAAGDVGGGTGGKIVLTVKGSTPEEARAQAATLVQMAHGNNDAIEGLTKLKGVAVKEAEGAMAAIAAGNLSPLSVELKGEKVHDYKLIEGPSGEPAEPHVGVAARLTAKVEAGTPVYISVPDDIGTMGESPQLMNLDPRMRALLSEMPADVVRQLEKIHGPSVGVKLGAEVQVAAKLYAPTDVGAPLLLPGGLEANADRLELTYKGKLEAGNTNVEVTHEVVVKDLKGLSQKIDMSADDLAVAMQDGKITREELANMVPDPEELDKYVDFNSKAEMEHFDGAKVDVLGIGGHMGISKKKTLYEMKDGEMKEQVDDVAAEFQKLDDETKFTRMPLPDADEQGNGEDSGSWTEWITDPGKKLDELSDDADQAYEQAKQKYDETKDDIEQAYEEKKEEFVEAYEEKKAEVMDTIDDAKQVYEEKKEEVVEAYEEKKEEVLDTIDDAKETIEEVASDPLGFMKDKLL